MDSKAGLRLWASIQVSRAKGGFIVGVVRPLLADFSRSREVAAGQKQSFNVLAKTALKPTFKLTLARAFQAGCVINQVQVSVGVNCQGCMLERDISN